MSRCSSCLFKKPGLADFQILAEAEDPPKMAIFVTAIGLIRIAIYCGEWRFSGPLKAAFLKLSDFCEIHAT